MKCEIIKDLLPLYIDNVCSKESKKLIEDHLQTCKECNEYLLSLKKSCEIEDNYYDEEKEKRKTNFILNMKKKLNNKKILTIVVTTLVVILTIVGVFKYLENKKMTITDIDNFVVIEKDGDLILNTTGSLPNSTYSVRFTLNENDKEHDCIVINQTTTKLLQMTAPKDNTNQYIIVYKDKGADTVDRIYYCANEDNMSFAESGVLTASKLDEIGYVLIYSK